MGRTAAITFVYLGRGTAFSTFVRELAEAAVASPGIKAEFVVADQTELADRLVDAGVPTIRIPTFKRLSPVDVMRGFFQARKRLVDRLAETRPDAVVTLMPHVWSPLMAPRIKRLGIRYATIVHDAVPHPGDPTAWATLWLLRDIDRADIVVTLSRTVAAEIGQRRAAASGRTVTLFHPDLKAGGRPDARRRDPSQPFRVLFFGRIMAYKGLPLLVEAVERLRADGISVELGVAGRGPLQGLQQRLEAVGAEVVNTWLSDAEVKDLLARYDAMACSHVEASQSGVAALAFGNGMPVVATPVGGVAEQVITGHTGVLAADATAASLADALRRLVLEPGLYEDISRQLAETARQRSMERFLADLVTAVASSTALHGPASG